MVAYLLLYVAEVCALHLTHESGPKKISLQASDQLLIACGVILLPVVVFVEYGWWDMCVEGVLYCTVLYCIILNCNGNTY